MTAVALGAALLWAAGVMIAGGVWPWWPNGRLSVTRVWCREILRCIACGREQLIPDRQCKRFTRLGCPTGHVFGWYRVSEPSGLRSTSPGSMP